MQRLSKFSPIKIIKALDFEEPLPNFKGLPFFSLSMASNLIQT